MRRTTTLVALATLLATPLLTVLAQATGAPAAPVTPAAAAATPPAGTQPDKPPPTPQELEQLVAPIALYPDSLLSQVLMASTYPLEVVQADRFAKANPKLSGEALTTALEQQEWDASVKSLVNFPTVLSMMSEKLDATIRLGDAFLADQKAVMTAVQTLRGKAKSQGNLQTTKEQTIIVESAPASTTQVIRIEPANPQVVYVPTVNPTVVYGTWPYPAYPPYAWHPPGYVAAGAIGFGAGVACGAAWGYAWGHANWNGGDVDIDVNRNANFNQNINRTKYQNQINNLQSKRVQGAGAGAANRQGSWQHDPAHRQGVAYRDQNTSQKFGGNNASARDVQSREAFRGRADAGRQEISRGGAGEFRGPNAGTPSVSDRAGAGNSGGLQNRAGAGSGDRAAPSAGDRAGAGAGDRAGAGNRAAPGAGDRASPSAGNRASPSAGDRAGGAANRPSPSTGNRAAPSGGGLSGVNSGARATQAASQRGNASRSASPSAGASARSAPTRSAPARSSGGGGRTGGGRR